MLSNALRVFKPLEDSSEMWRQLRATWRILVAAAGIQLIGTAISVSIQPFSYPFLNFWVGGALASLPGVLVGLAWQRSDEPRVRNSTEAIEALYKLGGTAMTVLAIPMALFQEMVRASGA